MQNTPGRSVSSSHDPILRALYRWSPPPPFYLFEKDKTVPGTPHVALLRPPAKPTLPAARAFSRMDKQASSADQAGLPEVGRKKASARSGNGPWALARVFFGPPMRCLVFSICSHLTIQRGRRRGRNSQRLFVFYSFHIPNSYLLCHRRKNTEHERTAPVVESMHEAQSPDDKSVSRYASPLAFFKAIFDSHY